MHDRHATVFVRMADAVLNRPGATDPALRRAVESRAAAAGGRTAHAPAEVPDELKQYVDNVARHAYRVTDADVEALRVAGYSEDALFEITVSAALGAGAARLERGLAALEEYRRAPQDR